MRDLGPRQDGFTLLEMLVVVFLIGLLTVAVTVRVVDPTEVDDAASVLAAELRYTAQRATATAEVHRLSIDLDEQRFRIEHRTAREAEPRRGLPGSPALLNLRPPEKLTEFQPIPNQQGAWRRLQEDDVRIASVRVGDAEYTDDVTFIGFAAEGGADPAEIVLREGDGQALRIRVLPFTGEVRVEPPDA